MLNNNQLKIRSITYTVDLSKIDEVDYQKTVSNNIDIIKDIFDKKNIFVRTVRINIIKLNFSDIVNQNYLLNKIAALDNFCKTIDVRWFNISFNLLDLNTKQLKLVKSISFKIINDFSKSFVNFVISDKESVNPNAALISSQLILDISKINDNGFDNFRFGVSLNPVNGTPFFPFSFSEKQHSFSFAVETTQAISNVIKKNIKKNNLEKLKPIIIKNICHDVEKIDSIGKTISSNNKLIYWGQDLSLSPYPNEKVSVLNILNLLGLSDFGSNGTLFLTSYLTGILKKIISDSKIKFTGFNGVMYSLLEDHLLAEANNKKLISIDKIISYSTMCGCGLDMVPVPGSFLTEELASVILDISTISIRLNKPLGVRVLPIQNKFMNEYTDYDMDFLTNTRIMRLKNLSIDSNFFDFYNFKL